MSETKENLFDGIQIMSPGEYQSREKYQMILQQKQQRKRLN
jgi:hypothetical protein